MKNKSKAARNIMNESGPEEHHILQKECKTAFLLSQRNSRIDLPPSSAGSRNQHVSKTLSDGVPEKVANGVGASAVIGGKHFRSRKRSSVKQEKKKTCKRTKEAVEDQLIGVSFDSGDADKKRILDVEKDYDESRMADLSAEKNNGADLRQLGDSSLGASEGDHGHLGTKSFTIVSGEVVVNLMSALGDFAVPSNSKRGRSKRSKKTSRAAELSVPLTVEAVSSFLKKDGKKEPTESLEEFMETSECNYSYRCKESNDTTVSGESMTNLDPAIAAPIVPALRIDKKSKHKSKKSGRSISSNEDPIKKATKVIEANPKEPLQLSRKYLGQDSKLVTIHAEFAALGGSNKLDSVVSSNTNSRRSYASEKHTSNSGLVCPSSTKNGLEISSTNEHKHENLEINLGMFNKSSENVLNAGINPDEPAQNLYYLKLSNGNLDGFFNESCDKCESLQIFAEKVAEDDTKRLSEKTLEECGMGTVPNMINLRSAELIEATNHMELTRCHSDKIAFVDYFAPKISQHVGNESVDITISTGEVPVPKNSDASVRSSYGGLPVTDDHSLDNFTVLSDSTEESSQLRERSRVAKISSKTKRKGTDKSIKKTSLATPATIVDGSRSEISEEETETNNRQSIVKDAVDSCTSTVSNGDLEESKTTSLHDKQSCIHAPGVEPIASCESDKESDGGSTPPRPSRILKSAAEKEFRMGDGTSSKGTLLDDLFAAFVYKGEGVRTDHSPPIRRSPNSVLASSKTKVQKEDKSFVPSSHLVTTINGERRVVSSYFKLPPGASTPIVLDRRDVEKAYQARLKPQQKLLGRFLQRLEKVKSASTSELEELDRTEKLKNYRRRKQRSVLSPQEKKMDIYKRLDCSSSWVPPPSPFGLLQEKHYYDPWRVLLICMLLNITTSRQDVGNAVNQISFESESRGPCETVLPKMILRMLRNKWRSNQSTEDPVATVLPKGISRTLHDK